MQRQSKRSTSPQNVSGRVQQPLVYLLCFAELLDYLGSHLEVFQKMIGHSVANP